MAFLHQFLTDSLQFQLAVNLVIHLFLGVNACVARLVATLVRDAKVFNVLTEILEVEVRHVICHSEVDNHMVLCALMALLDSLVYSVECFIAVTDGNSDYFRVLKMEGSFFS